jgi:hypothetical protein
MTWAKVDDRFPRHPKAMQAGPMACWLYVCGLCYANEHLTDGYIADTAVSSLAPSLPRPRVHARALVEAGLWEAAEGGFRIHDYHVFNPTAARIKAEREANRDRIRRYRETNRALTRAEQEVKARRKQLRQSENIP